MAESMSLQDIKEHVSFLANKHGWGDKTPELRFLFLASELGEVAKELLSLHYNKDEAVIDELKRRLGMEMYDVAWNLVDLATVAGVDIEEYFKQKQEYNRSRVWGKKDLERKTDV